MDHKAPQYSFMSQITSNFCFGQVASELGLRICVPRCVPYCATEPHSSAPSPPVLPSEAYGSNQSAEFVVTRFFLFSAAGLMKVKILLNLPDCLLLTRLPSENLANIS
jgi:hypothetical protein